MSIFRHNQSVQKCTKNITYQSTQLSSLGLKKENNQHTVLITL